MKTQERLRIAIQKSGRLNEGSIEFLASCGLKFEPSGKLLIHPCLNYPIDLLYLRDDDIPEYVSRSVADFGIVGLDVLSESDVELPIVAKLGSGMCKLMIAVPEKSPIKEIRDLEGERIATSYPKLLTNYLNSNHIEAAIIPISGSVEITPSLNLADAICDIVQAGTTLKAHNLKPIFTVMESQAVLVESPIHKPSKLRFIKKLGLN